MTSIPHSGVGKEEASDDILSLRVDLGCTEERLWLGKVIKRRQPTLGRLCRPEFEDVVRWSSLGPLGGVSGWSMSRQKTSESF